MALISEYKKKRSFERNVSLEDRIKYFGGAKREMPDSIKPMLTKVSEQSFDDDDWIFEMKWDGYRAMARIENSDVALFSRNQIEFRKFDQIKKELQKISGPVVLDGEIVSLDKNGRPDFQLLQNYLETGEGTVVYYVFDILFFGGYDLKELELWKRKIILSALFKFLKGRLVRISEFVESKGVNFFELIRQQGLEGMIAKNKYSKYQEGERSDHWLKVRNLKTAEVVICGYTLPKGSRKHIGSLIGGIYNHSGELEFAGHISVGSDEKKLEQIVKKLKPLEIKQNPFGKSPKLNSEFRWVVPDLVAEVKFTEWTREGIIRQPTFIDFREDKFPTEVMREDKSLVSKKTSDRKVIIDGKQLLLTNLDKIFWPKEGYLKKDLIDYYSRVADMMLPHLKGRPQSLHRFPDGISGGSFYQKNTKDIPDWITTIPIKSDGGRTINYMLIEDRASLLFAINLGCIDLNVWTSRIDVLDHPDFLVIDLDPLAIEFSAVIKTALETKKVLDELSLSGFVKTSGATGIHIYVPTYNKFSYDETREMAQKIAIIVNSKLPEISSIERLPSKRKGKVYIDFLQNWKGATMAAPYSVRPYPAATVSTPLDWNELDENLQPINFTMENIFARLKSKGDIWQPLLK